MRSDDPNLYKYFIAEHKDSSIEDIEDISDKIINKAVKEDRVYLFCRIHSQEIIDYGEQNGGVSIDYLESVIKYPHFSGDTNEGLNNLLDL
jgi:hypothetical protein